MTPHCIKIGSITPQHMSILEYVRREFATNMDEGDTCHNVCSAISNSIPEYLEWVKGKFNHADHSWLRFKDEPWIIIDAYPWACASGPILITAEASSPWRSLYVGEVQ